MVTYIKLVVGIFFLFFAFIFTVELLLENYGLVVTITRDRSKETYLTYLFLIIGVCLLYNLRGKK